jgi:tetratricopeptide (TPR) repeat protein
METQNNRKWAMWILAASSLVAVLAAYANHFHNSFHFDDSHTITQNPAIRSLENIPRFFTDGKTFSVFPTHASYRPIVSTSLALDYRMSGGLDPLWFHISTFFWYLVQLALMYLLFVRIIRISRPEWPYNSILALFAVAWYGLHPANAETVNYIIQRGDLYSTLGIVAGLVIYAYWRDGRKWGVYLLPVALGALSKPIALVFAPILFIYTLLFETGAVLEKKSLPSAARACLPAFLVCSALTVFQSVMTPKTFSSGAGSYIQYWLTQPIVALHYFKSFFLPTELSADTDRQLVKSLFSEASVVGLAFLFASILAVRYTIRKRETRPVAFGLLWFLVALAPTSLFPLAEVENDHRMFFPFVGLVLAVCSGGAVLLEKKSAGAPNALRRGLVVGGACCLLVACAYGVHERNRVWRSEESLWRDVTEKSPRNGRGLMNYGLTQLSKGNTIAANQYFEQAALLMPNYSTLEINRGVALGALHRDAEAEQHFRRAMALASADSQSYFFYGRWLQGAGRISEAISVLTRSAALNPADLDPRYTLMAIYSRQSNWADLKRVAAEVLRVAPGDAEALRLSALAETAKSPLTAAEQLAGSQPTPENFVNLSLLYNQTGRYEDCIRAAREALRLRPNYAEAYNNIAAGNESLGRWDEAIAAAAEAIRLKPDFQLARNNLSYAIAQRALQARQK